MTDSEFDALLRRALIDVVHEDYADILEGEPEVPPFTKRHLRRRRKLLADPVGYVRRLARPVWKKALRMAACILLALATLFGTVMTVSPSARAWMFEKISYWSQTHRVVFFTAQERTGIDADWRPSHIPDGFTETQSAWNKNTGTLKIAYENNNGVIINLTCKPASQGTVFDFDNEHSDYKEITINGHSADLFVSTTPGFPNRLLWTNTDTSIAYMAASTISADELVAIAEVR